MALLRTLSPWTASTWFEASAGTGKTYAIATLYVRLLTETELTVGQILVVTFTEAATAELRERLRARLQARVDQLDSDAGDEAQLHRRRLIAALADFDGAAIHTIHGFCHRLLRERSFEMGVAFDAELLREAKGLRQDVLIDFLVREFGDEAVEADGPRPPSDFKQFEKLTRDPLAHEDIVIEPASGAALVLARQISEMQPLFDRERLRELITSKTKQGRWVKPWLEAVEALLAGEDVALDRLSRALPNLALPALQTKLMKKGSRNSTIHSWPGCLSCGLR